jgi:hypothetical protein
MRVRSILLAVPWVALVFVAGHLAVEWVRLTDAYVGAIFL